MPALLASTLMVNMGFGAIFSLLAELQDEFNLPTWGLGLIIGSSFVIALGSQLLLASYADRGHAARLIMLGVAASTLGLAWMGLLADSLIELTAARALISLGEGALMPAVRRVVVVSEPDAVGRRLGQLGSAGFAGFLIGSPVAALVASEWGVRAPFLIMAVGCALTAPALSRMCVPAGDTLSSTKGVLGQLARQPAMRATTALVMAEYVSIGVFDSIWARYLTDLGAGTVYIGLSMAVFAAPLALLAPAGGRLADRHGAFRVAAIALMVTVPCQMLYGILGTIYSAAGLILVHTVFEAVAIPASQAAVAHASTPDAAASGQALAGTAGLATAAVVSLTAPALYEAFGAEWVFAVSGLAMAALIGYGVNLRKLDDDPAALPTT